MTRKFNPTNPRSPKRSSSSDVESSSSPPSRVRSETCRTPSQVRRSHTSREINPDNLPIASQPHITSIHHRNLYLASRPLIYVFDAAIVALYQLFSALRALLLLCWTPIVAFWRNRTTKCIGQFEEFTPPPCSSCGINVADVVDTITKHNKTAFENLLAGDSDMNTQTPMMNNSNNVAPSALKGGPGLTHPALARQKIHHRKAFEYISRALKIDEDPEGKITVL